MVSGALGNQMSGFATMQQMEAARLGFMGDIVGSVTGMFNPIPTGG
jgi:uncharacterized protein YqgC (DUF456 family)